MRRAQQLPGKSCWLRKAALGKGRAEQQLSIAHNRGQRIIQFVGNAGDKLAYRCHLFRLQSLD